MGVVMIDAEKLLGKVLQGAVKGGSYKKKGKKKYKKKKKSDDLMGGLLGGLTSGKGLVTAIGLGIGAYEILKNKSPQAQPQVGGASPSPAVPHTPTSVVTPPPLPSGGSPTAPPAVSNMESSAENNQESAEQVLAVRLIQTMVAAAHADGMLDEEEEQQILEKLQEEGLSTEEKQFLLSQLHNPLTIQELSAGISDPATAQIMYGLAVSTIIIDTPEERAWLDQLAASLGISENIAKFIEAEL